MMLATLPMYDLPELREATDAIWAAIAKAYGVTGKLNRNMDWTAAWRSPDLLFSQTCGYPFTHEFKEVLHYVGTPHYAADGCEGPQYRSIVFARNAKPLSEFEGSIAAFNNPDSMSGMLALQLVFAPLAKQGKFFYSALETASHMNSLQYVQSAKADICAIDCVTVAYLKCHRPTALEGLVEIARSPLVPALPFVTRQTGGAGLLKAVKTVLQDPDMSEVCATLLINDASDIGADAYDVILDRETAMLKHGGLEL